MRRAHKDTRMKSCGLEEGPIENVGVQGPQESLQTTLTITKNSSNLNKVSLICLMVKSVYFVTPLSI